MSDRLYVTILLTIILSIGIKEDIIAITILSGLCIFIIIIGAASREIIKKQENTRTLEEWQSNLKNK